MVFNTLAFVMFMTVTFLIYWFIPHKFRWMVLLAANLYFYVSFGIEYLLILIFTIVISYFAGLAMEKQTGEGMKKLLLAAGAGTPLFLLLLFKYADLKMMMPIGISFYTFQVIGYLIDIYRGKISAEHHLGKYAIFVSFFPNISSGPIERAGNFIPQISIEKKFDYD